MKFPAGVSDEEMLIKELKDPLECLYYLNGAFTVAFEEDEPELILLALYHIVQAQGLHKTARMAKLHRVSLHRMLTKGGNPEWRSLFRLFSALPMTLKVVPKSTHLKRAD